MYYRTKRQLSRYTKKLIKMGMKIRRTGTICDKMGTKKEIMGTGKNAKYPLFKPNFINYVPIVPIFIKEKI